MRTFAVFLVCCSSLSAQTPRTIDPGQSAAARESLRIERLQTLADLWGMLYLSHPYVVTTNVDWDKVLTDAIPQVEQAGTTEDFVKVLNESLLRPLGDPLALVRKLGAEVRFVGDDSIRARSLGGSIGYVDVRNPRVYAAPTFASRLASAVQSLGPMQSLVVDLRWQAARQFRGIDDAPSWLGMWVASPLAVGTQVSRVRRGWLQNEAAGQYWAVIQPSQLEPILPAIRIPTVFLVNNSAYSFLAPVLDALQSLSSVVVVWEQTGSFLEDDALVFQEGIQARLNTTMVLTHAAALGATPDEIVRNEIPDAQLPGLARETLLERQTRREPARAVFKFAMRPPVPLPVSTAPLTREQRMLGLFKIRTVLDEFYPHFEYSSLDWPNLLRNWIPRIEVTTSLREYYLELTRLGAGLNDSHVGVSGHPSAGLGWPGDFSIPVRLERVQGKIVVAEKFGADSLSTSVHVGDEVLAIDGRSVADVESGFRPLYSVSTEARFHRLLWMSNVPTRSAGESPVVLTLRNGPTTRTVTLRRTVRLPRPPAEGCRVRGARVLCLDFFHLINGNLGYINLTTVPDSAALDSAFVALWQTNGLVMDLRGQSGFGMASNLVRVLSRTPVLAPIVENRVMYGPGARTWETHSDDILQPDPNRHYAKPVVVLIDARAQSQPEYIGIWLRNSRRVIFVGSPTSGATGTASFINLPGGARFSFTSERVRYADGSRFQNIGITPDVVAEPTIDGIRKGRDEVLEKGIDVLRKAVATQPRRPQ